MNIAIEWAERGWIPDGMIRLGIRRLLRQRLRQQRLAEGDEPRGAMARLIDELSRGPLAVAVDQANLQHYEAPTEFFQLVLGPRMKYSSGLWPDHGTTPDKSAKSKDRPWAPHSERERSTRAENGIHPPPSDLAEAEEAMLDLFCQRAELQDGMEVLDLGCGWGSLSLWIAQRYPRCTVTAVSNSRTQKAYIVERCRAEGLNNVSVTTADVADFRPENRFDRVLSVEMLEHVRNHRELFRRISGWLAPGGKLAVHVFCHRQYVYLFETKGRDDWMGRHFFTGGMMPSDDWLARFQHELILERQWRVAGTHYARTLEAWLRNCDAHRDQIINLFAASLGPKAASRQFQRWRMFFMACAELFNYRQGMEWYVSHYLFSPRTQQAAV